MTTEAATSPTSAALPNSTPPSTATHPVPTVKTTVQVMSSQNLRLFSIMILSRRSENGGCVRPERPNVRYQWLRQRLAQPTGLGEKGEILAVRDPDELYELATEPPADLREPALLQALTGFVDAGSATRIARDHLLARPDATVLVRFDLDQLLDYRSRRPTLHFVEDHWESYDEEVLAIHLLRDDRGTPFLLLAGPEPDLQWERFIAAVISLVDRFNVRLTVGLTAIPMAVPHTRPLGVTAHGTRRELIADHKPWLQQVQVPASAGNLLEYRLGKAGRDAIGFAVHVPHYLAQSDYPAAADTLLTEEIGRASCRERV